MRKILILVMLLPLLTLWSQKQQEVCEGEVIRLESVTSDYVDARHVDIWLPEHYDGRKKFSVLYMHDGQMLYDASTTWNKQAWDVDDVASELFAQGKLDDFIVVGVWNIASRRHPNYFPQKPFDQFSSLEKDTVIQQLQYATGPIEVFQPNSNDYLKFLVNELKPIIDSEFNVYTDRSHTFVAGSSMGGLISMYAICEYPEVFGGAACLSTHWPGSHAALNNPIPQAFCNYMLENLPNPETHRIYFDYGDQTLDAMYPDLQKAVDKVMVKKGYTSENWATRFFAGKDHSEIAWNERLDIPLLFLLGKQ